MNATYSTNIIKTIVNCWFFHLEQNQSTYGIFIIFFFNFYFSEKHLRLKYEELKFKISGRSKAATNYEHMVDILAADVWAICSIKRDFNISFDVIPRFNNTNPRSMKTIIITKNLLWKTFPTASIGSPNVPLIPSY